MFPLSIVNVDMKKGSEQDLFESKVLRVLMIIIGTIAVVLGVIGIFLPVLPTTPFLLLAAILYARSSKRFYQWLMTNRFFGSYIKNYREKKGVPLKVKVFTIALLWGTISISAFFFVSNIFVRIGLFVIAAAVTIHLLWIRTLKREKTRS